MPTLYTWNIAMRYFAILSNNGNLEKRQSCPPNMGFCLRIIFQFAALWQVEFSGYCCPTAALCCQFITNQGVVCPYDRNLCCDGGFCNHGSTCCGAPHGGTPNVECCPAGTVCCPDGGCCPSNGNTPECCSQSPSVGQIPESTYDPN